MKLLISLDNRSLPIAVVICSQALKVRLSWTLVLLTLMAVSIGQHGTSHALDMDPRPWPELDSNKTASASKSASRLVSLRWLADATDLSAAADELLATRQELGRDVDHRYWPDAKSRNAGSVEIPDVVYIKGVAEFGEWTNELQGDAPGEDMLTARVYFVRFHVPPTCREVASILRRGIRVYSWSSVSSLYLAFENGLQDWDWLIGNFRVAGIFEFGSHAKLYSGHARFLSAEGITVQVFGYMNEAKLAELEELGIAPVGLYDLGFAVVPSSRDVLLKLSEILWVMRIFPWSNEQTF